MPGTAWWTWTPVRDTLSLKGPLPARIMRVMVRVVTNVTMKATKQRNRARRSLATISRSNQPPTAGWYRRDGASVGCAHGARRAG